MVLAIVIIGFLYCISLLEQQIDIIGAREGISDFENKMENEVLGMIFGEGDIKNEIYENITNSYKRGILYTDIKGKHHLLGGLSLAYLEEDNLALVKLSGKGRGDLSNKMIEVVFCPTHPIFLNKEGVFELKNDFDEGLREEFFKLKYKLENEFLKKELSSPGNTVNFVNGNKDFELYNNEKTVKDYIIDSIIDGGRVNYHRDNKKNFIIYLYDTINSKDGLNRLIIGNEKTEDPMELQGLIYLEGNLELVGDVNFRGLIIINKGELILKNNAILNIEGGLLNLNEDLMIDRRKVNIKYDLKAINRYGVYIPGYIKPQIHNIKIY